MYFFDVHVLYVRVICMRCEESKHTNSESYNRQNIQEYLPFWGDFSETKRRFFLKKHMCNAFFLWTPLISDESRKPDVASSKRLYDEEEEAW